MGFPLYHSSRQFVTLNVLGEHWERWSPSTEDERDVDELISESSFVREYRTRPEIHEELTLLEMCSSYYKKSGRWVRRRKQAVVRVFPRFQSDGTTKEQYYKQQVILKSSWRDLDELNPGGESWDNVYNRRFTPQANDTANEEPGSDSDDEESQRSFEMLRDEWMEPSAMGPAGDFDARELGTRDFDTSHPWTESYNSYENISEIGTFLKNCKRQESDQSNAHETSSSVQFSEEQKAIINLLELQISHVQSGMPASDDSILIRRVIVQGTAGTGKSTVIKEITCRLRAFCEHSFLLLAPTGVAAFNIGGKTVHSALRLPVDKKKFARLSSAAEREFQLQFQSC